MATREDVARLAGVSASTVSRVVNNNGYVSESNRKKIEDAIKALEYRPNPMARGLRNRATNQILFHNSEPQNMYYMEVYQGMDVCAMNNGYHIVVSGHYDSRMLQHSLFDGIIITGTIPGLNQFKDAAIPMVFLDYGEEGLDLPTVHVDTRGGMESAMLYLRAKGHRDVALLTFEHLQSHGRMAGFTSFLAESGVPSPIDRIVSSQDGANGFENGYIAAQHLLQRCIPCTAVVTHNDIMAIGAIAAFTEKGLRVPGDMSVVGFDDIGQAAYSHPPLTTVHMPKFQIGVECVNLLLHLIHGEAFRPVVIKTHLVERGSVRAIGTAGP